jgi:hypothetical protein
LFPFSLDERAKQWYAHNVGKVKGDWEDLRNIFGLAFFPIGDSQFPTKREGNHRCSLGQIFTPITLWPRLVYTKPCAVIAFLVRS